MSDRYGPCPACATITHWFDYGTGSHECSECGCHQTFPEELDIAALDAEYAGKMETELMGDIDDHLTADKMLVELLRKLGCDRTADAFDKLPKWYA